MAELNTAESGGKKKHGGKKRSKKMSTKVDLTPMVDLAFLLITFFMLTTTLNKPNAMELLMPKKPENNTPEINIKASQTLTLILDKDQLIWWYEGTTDQTTVANLKKTYFGNEKGVRALLLRKVKEVKDKSNGEDKLIVLIKNTKDAKYRDMVNILDEMDITDVKTFAIQDIDPLEVEAIKNGGDAATTDGK